MSLKTILLLASLVLSSVQLSAQHILIFSKTTGFRHDNIEFAVDALQELGRKHHLKMTHSEDAALFTDSILRTFDVVLFMSTTGTILNEEQKQAFQRFIQSGKGFVGIHAASDTEYEWPWYGKMVGGYFASHPKVQPADIQVIERKHLSTRHLPEIWHRTDEWYDFKEVNPNTTILLNLDEQSYQGGKMGKNHPLSWFHEYDGGRVFYTALGHTKEAFTEVDFLQHVLGGLRYALGEKNE